MGIAIKETMANFSTVILTTSAIIGAIYVIVSNTSKFKEWTVRNRKRHETLDELIDSAENLKTGTETIKTIGEQVEKISNQVSSLAEVVEKLAESQIEQICHNKRQDAEIGKSLEQRMLMNNALFAVLDGLKQLNVNGVVTEMWNELREQTLRLAHQNLQFNSDEVSGSTVDKLKENLEKEIK